VTARCAWCHRDVPIRADGKLKRHTITLPVSARAVHTVGAGSVQRRCSGSDKPPEAMR